MFKTLIFIFLFLTASTGLAKAADLNIVCTASDCTMTGGSPLFNIDKWLPGESVNKTLSVINKNSDDDCHLTMDFKNTSELPSGFGQKLNNIISGNGGEIVNKTLSQMFAQKHFFWQTIPAGQTRDFIWQVAFDPLTDNNYQGATASFDFDLTFACGVPPAPTATPPPPFGCSDAKPGLPTNFIAVSGPEADQVSLSWASPSPPYTYFLIAYSDSPDWPPKWGNPDIGNVPNYVVSGLGTGTYWFWLRAGNGCMPGDFVGPVAASASGVGAVAGGFSSGILGVETEIAPTPGEGELGRGISTEAGEVAGIALPVCPFWWIVLLAQTAILSLVYLIWNRRQSWPRFWFIFPFALTVAAYLIDRFAHTHWYSPSRFCPFEIYLGLFLGLAETVFFRRSKEFSYSK